MSQLERQFRILADHWHKGYGQEVKRSAIAFFVLIVIFFGACMAVPSLRELLAGQVLPHPVRGINVTRGKKMVIR